jgi:hypothetical protein
MNNHIVLACPHCHEYVLIYLKELNCRIFRHGVYKETLQQIDPHMSKDMCNQLLEKNLIHGCGKPFQVIEKKINNKTEYNSIICDYL